ncbi:MAG: hypothetical protein H6577_26965 [Lewinellaceae bacterium]|nr:hypothetical protein [Saprospiraceae bacterium]MCB9341784.1 hypothetical protein [Lewinellaceae bacterium]
MTHPFQKKINKLVNQHLKPIVNNANFQDSRYFQTAMFEMQDEMGKKLKAVEPQEVEAFTLDFLNSLKQLDVNEMLKRAKDQCRELTCQLETESEQAAALIELIEEAEKQAPFISFVILNRLHLLDLLRGIVEPEHLFKEYRRERVGEHRARVAMKLIGAVVENLYKHYIKVVWELWRVSQGDTRITTTDSYAFLTKKLIKQLPSKYQALIHEYASLLRNAAQHYSYWYEPKKDLIVVVQDNGQPPVAIKVHHVYKMAKAMYEISGLYFFHIHRLHTMKLFGSKYFLKPVLKAFKKANFESLDELGRADFREFEQQMELLFQPVRKYEFVRFKSPKAPIASPAQNP